MHKKTKERLKQDKAERARIRQASAEELAKRIRRLRSIHRRLMSRKKLPNEFDLLKELIGTVFMTDALQKRWEELKHARGARA